MRTLTRVGLALVAALTVFALAGCPAAGDCSDNQSNCSSGTGGGY